jgi:hypothetical protein
MYKSPFKQVRKTKEGLALKRWFKEEWKTPEGKEEYSKGDSGTFRPTKKVSKDTPKTYSELSPSDLAAAKAERKAKGRVSRYDRSELKKTSPAKQTKTNANIKVNGANNTQKANNKPSGNLSIDFQANTNSSGLGSNPFDTRSGDRTWKDLHTAEKGAAIAAGLMAGRAAASWIKNSKKK